VSEADVQAEVDRAAERYGSDAKLLGYFESDRGRNFIRSTLRRSQTVEKLIDEWLAAHPDHPPIPHAESDEPAAIDAASVEASAAIGATDPDAIPVSAGEPA